MHLVGLSKLTLGKDEEAVLWYRRSIELNRNFFLSHCFLAAALVGIGELEEARSSIKMALELNPIVSIALLRRVIRTATDVPAILAQAERVFDNLRKIGMPEG
jgi:tetratricopeptide (TPR) repeat protein